MRVDIPLALLIPFFWMMFLAFVTSDKYPVQFHYFLLLILMGVILALSVAYIPKWLKIHNKIRASYIIHQIIISIFSICIILPVAIYWRLIIFLIGPSYFLTLLVIILRYQEKKQIRLRMRDLSKPKDEIDERR